MFADHSMRQIVTKINKVRNWTETIHLWNYVKCWMKEKNFNMLYQINCSLSA